MRILLTGANGYIGMRLLPVLVEDGHEVTCIVRDRDRFKPSPDILPKVKVIEYDFLHEKYAEKIFEGLEYDVAYYLIHSLRDTVSELEQHEKLSAEGFVHVARITHIKQIIYLGGISNESDLSPHLSGRKIVKDTLTHCGIPYTIFEAGIIVGSGSASFEIIRDLCEKFPVMLGPTMLNSRCQPIAIRNVIYYLSHCMLDERTFNHTFEIGGPDVLSYRDMMREFAKVRGLRRFIFTFPFISTRIASRWLYFTTSTNFTIARQLVESMKNDVVCKDFSVRSILPQELYSYKDAIRMAFLRIEQNMVISSWKDAASSSLHHLDVHHHVEVPTYGCFRDRRWIEIDEDKIEEVSNRIFGIGGTQGWYYGDILWLMRGFIDKLVGGVGLRRGRRSETDLQPGDALDFWRVLLADRKNHRLLLFAEMKLPGEAWLEFSIVRNQNRCVLKQTATFRPHGIAGRNYWYAMIPFHFFIFRNMLKRIAGK